MRKTKLFCMILMFLGLSACKSSKDSGPKNEIIVDTEVKEAPSKDVKEAPSKNVKEVPSEIVNTGRPLVGMEIWTREQAKSGPDTFRLAVTFISIGAGTDPEAKTSLDAYVYDYKLKTRQPVAYVMIPWGREGEVDCCFTLTELNASEQKNFIEGMKKAFIGRDLVQINENFKSRFK